MVYLIHFEDPIRATRKSKHYAQHYIGYTADVEQRFDRHQKGHGSLLIKAAKSRDIGFKIVRTWEGGRQEERQLKRQKNALRYCPICSQKSFQDIDKNLTSRTRVIGSSTIRLSPNPRYMGKHPEIMGNVTRKRVVDLNKFNKKK